MHQVAAANLLKVTGELVDTRWSVDQPQLEDRAREIQFMNQAIETLRVALSSAEKETAQLQGELAQLLPAKVAN